MVKKENRLYKDFIWNVIGSSFFAFNSLFFLIIVTRINGINIAGTFTFGFSTACLFYIVGVYSGRIYQVTDDDKKISDTDYLYSKFITCIAMIVFSMIFCLMRNYTSYKINIILGLVAFKALEAFSEFSYAILQEKNELYKVGISLFLKAVVGLLCFFLIDYYTKNVLLSIYSLVFVNIIFILFYDFKNLKLSGFKKTKFDKYKSLKVLKNGFYVFAFSFLTQYIINAQKYPIDSLLNNKAQTIFGIIIMPATIVILLGQFIIQPFLLKLKINLQNDKKSFLTLTLKLAISVLILGILIIILGYFFGIKLLNIIYGINITNYLKELMIILIGAVCYGISLIFSTSLTTMRSTFSQLVVFSIVSIITLIISKYFVNNYHILGASIAYMISMVLLLILYIIVFVIIFKKKYSPKK